MKPLRSEDIILFDWGKPPHRDLLEADQFTCPHCQKFSFFCAGNFRVCATTAWRASVVGFSTKFSQSKEVAGVATLQCGFCTRHFTLPLGYGVLEAYQADCDLWPKSLGVFSP